MNAVQQYIETAFETIKEAELLFEHKHFRASVSRSYYASFYSIQASLESIQINVKTHQGALVMFSRHFIKTNILPKHYGKFFQDNLEQRIVGDYEIGFKASEEDAKIALEYAKEIAKGIKEYLT